MMPDVTKYTYRSVWSQLDGEYVALVEEFPSLSWLDETQAKALDGLVGLVDEVIRDMEESGEAIPQPIALCGFPCDR